MERTRSNTERFVAMDSALAPSSRPGMTNSPLLHLGQHLLRGPHRIEHHRRAGIQAHMQEDLADLLARDTVVDRAAHMAAQLVLAVQDREHRKVQHAARLAGEAL